MRICTCRNLFDELGSGVAALHQQMSPRGQLLGRIHPEHMGLHALLGARTQAEREVRIQERRALSWAGVDQSKRGEEENVNREIRSVSGENEWVCMFVHRRAEIKTESLGESLGRKNDS